MHGQEMSLGPFKKPFQFAEIFVQFLLKNIGKHQKYWEKFTEILPNSYHIWYNSSNTVQQVIFTISAYTALSLMVPSN